MKSMFIFNPAHDLSLANDDPNFNPPLSARKLETDLSCLPVWFAPNGSLVWSSPENTGWLNGWKRLLPGLSCTEITSVPDFQNISAIHPWGWDKSIAKQLLVSTEAESGQRHALTHLLPSENHLAEIKRLSHRRTAAKALHYLRSESGCNEILPLPAIEIQDLAAVEHYSKTHAGVIFKAPWSGSGKGLCWVRGSLSDSHRGWCRNVLEKQGSLMAEQIYDVAQNFALLFRCENGKASFAGYSLFETEKGIYRSNSLLSDDAILARLSRFIQPQLLLAIRELLQPFIDEHIAPFYSGMLGVDMFIFNDNNTLRIHPCVEINLRMTMGAVARIFFDRFVSPGCSGRFSVDHCTERQALWQDHTLRKKNMPLIIENGKISSGYLSLSPVLPDTHYRVRVELASYI